MQEASGLSLQAVVHEMTKGHSQKWQCTVHLLRAQLAEAAKDVSHGAAAIGDQISDQISSGAYCVT